MAPEFVPSVVIFDARFDGDSLRGTLEYLETPNPDQRLRVRWSVESQPKDYRPFGGGVAYIYEKFGEIGVVPISEDAKPTHLGGARYQWTEGLQPGRPWVMFILILPQNHTLVDPQPFPVGTKIFKERLALYWILEGDKLGRTMVEFTIKLFERNIQLELIDINKRYLSHHVPSRSSITVEDGGSSSDQTEDRIALKVTGKRFRVALSFPGEYRAFVEQVAELLARRVGRDHVLYDKYYEAEFARPNLDSYLQNLYHDESDLIAIFLCADYDRKEWCGLEWRALRDVLKRRRDADLMPLRFDDTQIPGLFSIDGYVWIGTRKPREVADLILQRIRLSVGAEDATSLAAAPAAPLEKILSPRTPDPLC
jgi:hypothetical protein